MLSVAYGVTQGKMAFTKGYECFRCCLYVTDVRREKKILKWMRLFAESRGGFRCMTFYVLHRYALFGSVSFHHLPFRYRFTGCIIFFSLFFVVFLALLRMFVPLLQGPCRTPPS
ncbi:hypothetical protein, unlikely [Trypanosoma brucei gambiense DAL972]|uniref:Uncharacterized protein n=1 Tax=Trypanosoma brucei gambiense (strain MHOM/CI/86/DAL972) TaxID=679716 RepID=C9ZVX3_TRYB9|nr:hypothetical protein, unlikely [Trypanosoma brucei gambiense DAL972]CBH13561.1 hypothetical protein, unlikely [Trypanosoma brucei gambiense DAL972]|eukprot:XP_011775838.1 hypothetical protein, unlikely [Trypanosoma brucei gambiense DAL972]